uniref:CHK kinase-like domain-containing protein n=1 Tax=Ceratitis capitata TaxID=7213 RepID=W8AYD7_CERCA
MVKKDKMNEVPLFETEVGVYTKVLPKIEAKLREFGDQTILAPKLFHYSLQAPRCIVFEDLVVEGYTTINNRHCSLEEVKMALTKLAKMHAISYQMIHRDNNHDLANFNKTFVNTIDLADFPVLGNGIKLIKDVISDQSDLQKFLPHIESVERFLIPKVIDLLNATKNGNQSGVQVLNHGDFHVKNLMVKNDGNKLKDLMVLDYQVSIFGSPAIDLHYAFTMMYSPSMRRERMDELLYYYIINLQETLRKVEFHGHIPTIQEIRAEMQAYRHWGMYEYMKNA